MRPGRVGGSPPSTDVSGVGGTLEHGRTATFVKEPQMRHRDQGTMSDGWAYVAALVVQWTRRFGTDSTIAFLEAHDPFRAAFDVT